MTLRVKIVLICLLTVAGLLVLFSAISVVRFFQKRGQPPVVEEPVKGEDNQLGTTPAPTPLQEQTPPPPPAAKPGDEVISLVVPFVERFGSYSNQGEFENLSDLLPFMSGSMQVWAEKQIKEQSEKPFQKLYRGVTTKALSHTVVSHEPEKGRAEMRISTQRREMIGSGANARVYPQDVIVKLVKDDGAWVVDSAFWQ